MNIKEHVHARSLELGEDSNDWRYGYAIALFQMVINAVPEARDYMIEHFEYNPLNEAQ